MVVNNNFCLQWVASQQVTIPSNNGTNLTVQLPRSLNNAICSIQTQIKSVDGSTDWARTNITIQTTTKTNVKINFWSFGNMARYNMFIFIIGY